MTEEWLFLLGEPYGNNNFHLEASFDVDPRATVYPTLSRQLSTSHLQNQSIRDATDFEPRLFSSPAIWLNNNQNCIMNDQGERCIIFWWLVKASGRFWFYRKKCYAWLVLCNVVYLGKNKLTLQIKTGRFKFLEIKFHKKGTYAKTFMLSNAATAMGFTGDDKNFTMTHIKRPQAQLSRGMSWPW